MKITQRIQAAVKGFSGTTKNSANLRNARDFLKYGNGESMTADWSQVIMSDEDSYTGYLYGAIDIRAVAVTKIGEYNLATKAKAELLKKAKASDELIVHPYIELIDESLDFSNFDFWYDNSTYLDLKGVAYILAVRNVGVKGVVGKVQEFKILNPYNVQRIFDNQNGKLIGYKEYKNGMSRELPVEMVIPIIKLNPFNQNETYSMVDAAKDQQFTLKTASDYTRAAIRNNQNAPGIISTDAVLEGEELKNFKSRVMGRVKGEPLFGGGAGSIKWEDMQSDLNKAALKDVNSISLNNIIAVSGASKTMLGIEESGTTKDTSKTQKDNFIDYRAIPNVQKIIDALNQDYKRYYNTDYERTKYKLFIDNPLGSDRDAEQKDVTIRSDKEELYNHLVNKGYDREIAAKYADGQITLVELGAPKNKPVVPVATEPEPKEKEEPAENKLTITHEHKTSGEVKITQPKAVEANQVDTGLLNTTQASLQNSIVNLDERMIAEIATKINTVKNDFESESDVITERKKKEYENELEIILASFYAIILPLFAYNVLSDRATAYGKIVSFKMNNEVKAFIKDIANKAAQSHIETTINSVYKFAQEQSLAGKPRDVIARDIINKYGDEIARSRAVAIARTETNRAFTMSQFSADKQFVKQAGLTGRAYKQWVTRTSNPCPFCQSLAAKPPIPLEQNFADIGDELTGTEQKDGKTVVKKMTVGFADLEAGNAHTNCGCTYELIIRDA